jgi:hypothetical protein
MFVMILDVVLNELFYLFTLFHLFLFCTCRGYQAPEVLGGGEFEF